MSGENKARLRGEILRLVYRQHERQKHRYDDITLTGVLTRLGHDTYVNQVRMLLQDLRERGFLAMVESKNGFTGETSIAQIEIRPMGRDIVERRERDRSILLIEDD